VVLPHHLLPVQVCSAFEQAVRCVCCPINHNYEMLSTYMANDFEYLKKALGLRRKDLRTELRSAKRKSRVRALRSLFFLSLWLLAYLVFVWCACNAAHRRRAPAAFEQSGQPLLLQEERVPGTKLTREGEAASHMRPC
jgi:hypothetical protein